MFPVKFVGDISRILLSYCDRYVVSPNYDIILEPQSDGLYICRAYLNDLRQFAGYKDFMVNAEVAKDLRDIKAKTITEEHDMLDNLVLNGTTTISPSAKNYRELDITLVHGVTFQHEMDNDKAEFLRQIWVRAGSFNYTTIPTEQLIGTNKFLEIPILDNDGEEQTLLTSTSEFYFGKTFIDMSASLVDAYSLYQEMQKREYNREYAIVRMRYSELTLYMLVAISV